MEAVAEGTLKPGDVVVIRYEGPQGGPGMREMLAVTGAIKGAGLGKDVLLLTDGRFSGGDDGSVHRARRARGGRRRADRVGRATATDRAGHGRAHLDLQVDADELDAPPGRLDCAGPKQHPRGAAKYAKLSGLRPRERSATERPAPAPERTGRWVSPTYPTPRRSSAAGSDGAGPVVAHLAPAAGRRHTGCGCASAHALSSTSSRTSAGCAPDTP